MGENDHRQIEAIEEQIQKLRKIRKRWADGQDLTDEEKLKRNLTLELLDGAIEDLITTMWKLREQGKTK